MLHTVSISQLREQLASKQVSAVEVAQHFLDRIEAQRDLNTMITVDADATLRQAAAADVAIANGQFLPLTGIPLAYKDVFVTRDFTTTAGSQILGEYKSPFDATAIARLGAAGAGGARITCLVVHRAARQRQWRRACVWARRVRIRAARFANPHHLRASRASSRLMAASRAMA